MFKTLLAQGSSNIYLADLMTGTVRRITTVSGGQHALFPHFRSDGWIYFQLFDGIAGKRYALATDASVRVAKDPAAAPVATAVPAPAPALAPGEHPVCGKPDQDRDGDGLGWEWGRACRLAK